MVILYIIVFLLSVHIHSFGMSDNVLNEEANTFHKSSLQCKYHDLDKKIKTITEELRRARTELAGYCSSTATD